MKFKNRDDKVSSTNWHTMREKLAIMAAQIVLERGKKTKIKCSNYHESVF